MTTNSILRGEDLTRETSGPRPAAQQHRPPETVELPAKQKRRVRPTAGRGFTKPRTCQVIYHGFSAPTRLVYQYMLDMTSGGSRTSRRYFYGSIRNTARLLSLSESTVAAAFKELLSVGLIMLPVPEQEWSKFGSRNYAVITHDEWVAEDGERPRCEYIMNRWEFEEVDDDEQDGEES